MNTSTKGQSITTNKPSRLATRKSRARLATAALVSPIAAAEGVFAFMNPVGFLFIHGGVAAFLLVGFLLMSTLMFFDPEVNDPVSEWIDRGTK